MVLRRKEAKSYGTKVLKARAYEFIPHVACLCLLLLQRVVEGKICEGANCLVVEDVVTTGGSVLETVSALKSVGFHVDTAVVLLDRQQGGMENLFSHGIQLYRSVERSLSWCPCLCVHSSVPLL